MKVLILVGRFHPNLTEWVEAFRSAGDVVEVIAGGEAVNKDARVTPRIVPPEDVDRAMAERLAAEVAPDLVIMRNKERGYRRVVRAARRRGAATIYYDQRAFLRPRGWSALRRDVGKVLSRAWEGYPRVGITPTLGRGEVPRFGRHWIRMPMPVAEGAEEREYFRDGVPSVLLVGRLANRKKRHLWVLQALEEYSGPYRLTVAGAGDDSDTSPGKRSRDYYERVCETLSAPRHRDNVKLLEDVPHERMTELYRRADIFVLPSTQELLGISVVEAMACGCAVLASDGVGAVGYISDGKDGVVFDGSSYEAFRDRLHSLLADASRVRALGRNATRTVRERHRHEDFVRQVREVAGLQAQDG